MRRGLGLRLHGSDTCQPLPGLGEPCPNAACAEGLWCQTIISDSSCAARLGPGSRDEACLSESCSGGECSGGGGVLDRPGPNETCAGPCIDELVCAGGTCVANVESSGSPAICTLGVSGNVLVDGAPPGTCQAPFNLPSGTSLAVVSARAVRLLGRQPLRSRGSSRLRVHPTERRPAARRPRGHGPEPGRDLSPHRVRFRRERARCNPRLRCVVPSDPATQQLAPTHCESNAATQSSVVRSDRWGDRPAPATT